MNEQMFAFLLNAKTIWKRDDVCETINNCDKKWMD